MTALVTLSFRNLAASCRVGAEGGVAWGRGAGLERWVGRGWARLDAARRGCPPGMQARGGGPPAPPSTARGHSPRTACAARWRRSPRGQTPCWHCCGGRGMEGGTHGAVGRRAEGARGGAGRAAHAAPIQAQAVPPAPLPRTPRRHRRALHRPDAQHPERAPTRLLAILTLPLPSATTRYGTCLLSSCTSLILRPMKRLTEKKVFSGFTTAWRLAICGGAGGWAGGAWAAG